MGKKRKSKKTKSSGAKGYAPKFGAS